MNKCVNCGNDLIPGDKFCRRCGTPINNQNNMSNGMPSQMSNNNVHFTNNMNTQIQNNTGYNQYNNNYNNNFNNNLNSNVNYNMNNSNNKVPQRKDNLSTLIVIIVVLVIGVLFILFMPTIKKSAENDTIIIKDNQNDSKKDNNSSINTGKDNNSSNNNNGNNNGNNSNQKNTITFYETTLNKRNDYSYKFSSSGTVNYLVVQNKNNNDEVIVQGIYKSSISNINKNSSVIKQKYSQAGYKTGAAKYTTYKGKKLYTLEISKSFSNGSNMVTYKMLVGFYEIESGIVASIQIGDIGYTKFNYAGYEFLANIFDGAKVSSAIKNGASYEIKADLLEILNKLLTKE